MIGLLLLTDALTRAGVEATLRLTPAVLLTLWLLCEIGPASFVRIDDAGVTVQNMLRRTRFGWQHVRDVDMQWQLVFRLADDQTVTAFGGPARARPRRSRSGDEQRGAAAPGGYRELAEIRDRWEAAGPDEDAPIRREWDAASLAALALILGAGALSLLVST